jgi:glucose/arabinose dehydrogenase
MVPMMKRNQNKSNLRPLAALLLIFLTMGFTVLLLPAFINPSAQGDAGIPPITAKARLIADGLHSPTAVTFPGNGDIWVTEQTGFIRVIKNGKLLINPLLDLRGKMIKVNGGYEERGLLSIALHPKFKSNKKFYVFYSAPSAEGLNHKGVVAEYKLAAKGAVDPASGRVI